MNNIDLSELLEIAGSVCDEQATDQQLRRLSQILDGDRQAQRHYFGYMSLHAELFWKMDSLVPADGSLDSGHLAKMDSSTARPSRNHRARWMIGMAATLLLGTGFGFLANELNQSNHRDGISAIESAAVSPILGKIVATVTGTRDSRWTIGNSKGQLANAEPIGFGSELYEGQELRLVEGLAEITYKSGVKVILEAPAALDLRNSNESVLHQGRLTAAVPPGAEGFQIACQGLTLIDRGTEFGVRSDESGQTEVHVFNGLVEGHVKHSNGSTLRKVSWKTNDVVRYISSTNEFKPVEEPIAFVRSLSRPVRVPGLVVAEDFDYPVGPLEGQNGGYGWAGPWENIVFADDKPDSNGVGPGSLPIEGIDHVGNHASINGHFNRIRRILGTSFSGVFDAAGLIENQDGARLIGQDGTTLYIGFSQRVGKLDDVFYGFELNRGDGNLNRVLCIGHAAARGWNPGPPRTPNKGAGVTGWSVTSEFNGSAGTLLEFGELGGETTEPVFFVVRIDFGQNNEDKVSVYLNPRSLLDEQQNKPVVSGNGNFSFDRISLANFEGDKTYDVDDIRMGTSFSSVAGRRGSNKLASSSSPH